MSWWILIVLNTFAFFWVFCRWERKPWPRQTYAVPFWQEPPDPGLPLPIPPNEVQEGELSLSCFPRCTELQALSCDLVTDTCTFNRPVHLSLMQNHPKVASELKTCPFNACHLVPKNELTHHTETCGNRMSLDPRPACEIFISLSLPFPCRLSECASLQCLCFFTGDSPNGHVKWQVPASTWVNPNETENWDEGTI